MNNTPRKIVDWDTAAQTVRAWRSFGMRIGFTNGCFDLVHPGHIASLSAAASQCDRLIVGLNADASVARLKGPTRPVQNQDGRATVLAAMMQVDLVVIFDEDTPQNLIETILPNVLFKGADYSIDQVAGAKTVIENGGEVVLLDLVPEQSTSALIAKSNKRRIYDPLSCDDQIDLSSREHTGGHMFTGRLRNFATQIDNLTEPLIRYLLTEAADRLDARNAWDKQVGVYASPAAQAELAKLRGDVDALTRENTKLRSDNANLVVKSNRHRMEAEQLAAWCRLPGYGPAES